MSCYHSRVKMLQKQQKEDQKETTNLTMDVKMESEKETIEKECVEDEKDMVDINPSKEGNSQSEAYHEA